MHIETFIKILISGALSFSCMPDGKQIISTYKSADSVLLCPGYCILENNNVFVVSAPFEGRIISVKSESGNEVNKGQILAIIENSDFLILQQEYLEAKNMVEFHEEEYARQGELTIENATTIKKMQLAKRDYTTADLKYQSLRKQLIILGLNPDSLKADKIKTTLPVLSSGKGTVIGNYMHRGSYVHKGEKLFDISENRSLLLQLQVPEIDIMQIRMDQKIDFYCTSDSGIIMEAKIVSEAKIVDPLSHTGTVIAKPVDQNIKLLPGMTVTAIISRSKSQQ